MISMTPQQAHNLLIYGYSQLLKENETPVNKGKEEEPQTAEEQIATLRQEIESLRNERNSEKQYSTLNNTLSELANNYPETKEDPDIRQQVVVETLARFNLDPNQDIKKLFKESYDRQKKILAKVEERLSKKFNNSNKMNQFLDTPPKITGSSPLIKDGKKLPGSALADGTARRVFLDLLKEN